MANLNRIVLVGRLMADPEVHTTLEGLPMTKFRLMVNRPLVGGGNGADLIEVVAWRRLAEICGDYLKKGQLVLVEGRIQNRSFEDQLGQKRWVVEVVARSMTMLERSEANIKRSENSNQKLETKNQKEEVVGQGPVDEFVDDAELVSDLPF